MACPRCRQQRWTEAPWTQVLVPLSWDSLALFELDWHSRDDQETDAGEQEPLP
jgi:hypothetical protein